MHPLDARTHQWFVRLDRDGLLSREKLAHKWLDALAYHRELEQAGLVAILPAEVWLREKCDSLKVTVTDAGRAVMQQYEMGQAVARNLSHRPEDELAEIGYWEQVKRPDASWPSAFGDEQAFRATQENSERMVAAIRSPAASAAENEVPSPQELTQLAESLHPLVKFGTSTWTYPGWVGLIYKKPYPKTGATAKMLAEYAQWPLARTVGIDSFFYTPPSAKTLQSYADALPPDFKCVMKVWREITAHTFNSPEDKDRRGEVNANWLNADLFLHEVIGPLREHFMAHTGPIILELEAFPKSANMSPEKLADVLDAFFSQLPPDMPYAVELRSPELLTETYLNALRRNRVAHVFNSWTRMPSISEQFLLHDSVTADFIVSRALLKPGRTYQKAVESFAPYDRIQDPSPEMRQSLAALAREAVKKGIPAYLIINNRSEGSAPLTIAAIARILDKYPA